MADESRYDRNRTGRDYFGHDSDRDRDDYRSRNYGGRDDLGRSYRGEGGYEREGRNWGAERGGNYDREYGGGRNYRQEGGAGYDRSGGGYAHPDESGLGYNREGYGYGNHGREDFGRRSGADHGSGDYRGSQRGRGGYGGRGGEDRGFWERTADEVSSWFGDEDAERRRQMDERRGGAWHTGGEHRGRGPSGYTRSDERIREDVSDRLTDDPNVDASNIMVQASGDEVTLSGTVDSRWAKRRAEDIAEDISGVKHVQNNLRVQQQGTLSATAGKAGDTARQDHATSTTTDRPGTGVGRSSNM